VDFNPLDKNIISSVSNDNTSIIWILGKSPPIAPYKTLSISEQAKHKIPLSCSDNFIEPLNSKLFDKSYNFISSLEAINNIFL
jgi:hypothetical protein